MSFYNMLQKQTMTAKSKTTTIEKKISRIPMKSSETEEMDEVTADNLPLEFVKQYLRVDHDFDDAEIQVAILSAQSYVRNYIKQPDGVSLDMGLITPILVLTAFFYENKTPNVKSTEKLDEIFKSTLNLHRNDIL